MFISNWFDNLELWMEYIFLLIWLVEKRPDQSCFWSILSYVKSNLADGHELNLLTTNLIAIAETGTNWTFTILVPEQLAENTPGTWLNLTPSMLNYIVNSDTKAPF